MHLDAVKRDRMSRMFLQHFLVDWPSGDGENNEEDDNDDNN